MRIYSILLLTILIWSCQPKKEEKKIVEKPNVLFISIDDLRNELGCYGKQGITPNMDALAQMGMAFKEAYCQAPVCAPSRASVMTGLRPDSTRVWYLGEQFRVNHPNIVTIPMHFKKNGYHTVSMGKIFHNHMPDSMSFDEPDLKAPAFIPKPGEYIHRDGETYLHTEEGLKRQKEGREKVLEKYGESVYANGWFVAPGVEISNHHDSIYYDGAQTEAALRKLKSLKEKDEPFFFALGYFRPHLPFVVPQKYWDMYEHLELAKNDSLPKNAPIMASHANEEIRCYLDYEFMRHPSVYHLPDDSALALRRGYFAGVSYIDACVGRLIQGVKEMGLDKNTIIVLWGDHGWKLGEHNGWGKMTNWNIDAQVPLIIYTPNNMSNGTSSSALVELVDIYPTLCDLAGIELPNYLQGTSLKPLMSNPELEWKDAVFTQHKRVKNSSADKNEYMGRSITTKQYHYIEWRHWNDEAKTEGELAAIELYDHKVDPDENENVANYKQYKKIQTELSVRLKAGWRAAKPKS